MISILSLSSTGLIGSNHVLKCCHSTISLIISKQLLHTLSDVLAIIQQAVFYAELSKKVCYLITIKTLSQDSGEIGKKVEKGDEYQNFLLKKKFFIHYFLTFIPASV
jgi:hypothetical protein